MSDHSSCDQPHFCVIVTIDGDTYCKLRFYTMHEVVSFLNSESFDFDSDYKILISYDGGLPF